MDRLARFLCSFLLLGIMPSPACSSDRQLWTTVGATAELDDRWRLSQDAAARFSGDKGGLYEILTTTSLGYRVGRGVAFWAGYTHDSHYSDGHFTVLEQRVREQVTFDDLGHLGKAKLSGRLRFEQRWRGGSEGAAWRARPYLKLSLPLKGRTAVNFSSEGFITFNTTSFQDARAIDRMRNMISISAPLSKRLSGETGYMNQHSFLYRDEEGSNHIVYFAISLKL